LSVSNGGFTLRSSDNQRATISGNLTLQDSADSVRLDGLNLTGGSGFTLVDIHGDNDAFVNVDVAGSGVRNCLRRELGRDGGRRLHAVALACP
jgi:hypothetical protein